MSPATSNLAFVCGASASGVEGLSAASFRRLWSCQASPARTSPAPATEPMTAPTMVPVRDLGCAGLVGLGAVVGGEVEVEVERVALMTAARAVLL